MRADNLSLQQEAISPSVWTKIFPMPASARHRLVAFIESLFRGAKTAGSTFAAGYFPKYAAPVLLVMPYAKPFRILWGRTTFVSAVHSASSTLLINCAVFQSKVQ